MTLLDKFESLFRYPDKRGNTVELQEYSPTAVNVILTLQLPGGEAQMNIGQLKLVKLGEGDEQVDGIVYHKFENESQMHRNTKSWSVNKTIADNVDVVVYQTESATYTIKSKDIRKHGLLFPWDKGTHDYKVFVPVRFWTIETKDPFASRLIELLGYDWYHELGDQFNMPYMDTLMEFIEAQRERTLIDFVRVFPAKDIVFRAFKETPFTEVKVVILGQDPYHDGSATGLAFDNGPDPKKMSPSLRNILTEVNSDVYEGTLPTWEPDLLPWAQQGVLLLNTILTVTEGKPGSHADKGWELFTRQALINLVKKRKNIVYMLWGAYARKYAELINPTDNLILTAAHPSPFSAANGFFGCKHFSKANAYLLDHGQQEIRW